MKKSESRLEMWNSSSSPYHEKALDSRAQRYGLGKEGTTSAYLLDILNDDLNYI